jgi:putative membrane protein
MVMTLPRFPRIARTLASAAAIGALMSACAMLPSQMAVPASASGPDLDALFVSRAAQTDVMEITASRMALQRATRPEVRQYAQSMISDHTRTSAELQQIASQISMPVDARPTEMDEKKMTALSAAQGEAFDKAYVMVVGVQAHTEAVTLFKQEASKGSNPALVSFATRTLPSLQHHLEMAAQLEKMVK